MLKIRATFRGFYGSKIIVLEFESGWTMGDIIRFMDEQQTLIGWEFVE